LILTTKNEEDVLFLKQFLHKINYFGKRGCFFQFIKYKDISSIANVQLFDEGEFNAGILQEYDNFNEKLAFEHVNNYGGKTSVKREKQIFVIPLERRQSSKSYTMYNILEP